MSLPVGMDKPELSILRVFKNGNGNRTGDTSESQLRTYYHEAGAANEFDMPQTALSPL